jgi:hypothetical protein
METNIFKEGYHIRDQQATHFLTFTICEWIDAVLRSQRLRRTYVLPSLRLVITII